jgi:hypothetical protein
MEAVLLGCCPGLLKIIMRTAASGASEAPGAVPTPCCATSTGGGGGAGPTRLRTRSALACAVAVVRSLGPRLWCMPLSDAQLASARALRGSSRSAGGRARSRQDKGGGSRSDPDDHEGSGSDIGGELSDASDWEGLGDAVTADAVTDAAANSAHGGSRPYHLWLSDSDEETASSDAESDSCSSGGESEGGDAGSRRGGGGLGVRRQRWRAGRGRRGDSAAFTAAKLLDVATGAFDAASDEATQKARLSTSQRDPCPARVNLMA